MTLPSLSQDDVFDLVIEYLKSKGYTETEQVLQREVKHLSSVVNGNDEVQGSRLGDLLEKSYVTEMASGDHLPRKKAKTQLDTILMKNQSVPAVSDMNAIVELEKRTMSIDTKIISFNPCENDPYGASSMPIYQTATFAQPAADQFGDYDYTRSGNPTRDALQKQIAGLEGVEGARAFCFTTGMAALTAVINRLI
jgi:cystathionine beta-lyase